MEGTSLVAVEGRSPGRVATKEVDRLAAAVIAGLPGQDPASSGESPSYMTRRWMASRQAGVDRLVSEIRALSPPPRPPDPDLEQRMVRLVRRLLEDRTERPASPARASQALGSGI